MNHNRFMQQALEIAKKGLNSVAPNPMVGCVIVKEDEIIASGYHQKYGEAHAEVNAIASLPSSVSPSDCQLYVTLEPCSHHGKTPPCVDLIISKGFKKVIVACKDPNPLVAGKGIEKLQAAGIEVTTGILEQESRGLNKKFIAFYENKRPYYILKWAQTADGFISKIPTPEARIDNQISGKEAQLIVHQLRADNMGIFVGKNTVLNDNPSLTTRLVKGNNPIRIFIDENLEVPLSSAVYNAEAKTIVFNGVKDQIENNIQFICIDFTKNVLEQISEKLYQLGVQSVLVEGGAFLLNDFINQKLWDEVFLFQNPNLYFKSGLPAPIFALKNSFELIGNDKLFKYVQSKEA